MSKQNMEKVLRSELEVLNDIIDEYGQYPTDDAIVYRIIITKTSINFEH